MQRVAPSGFRPPEGQPIRGHIHHTWPTKSTYKRRWPTEGISFPPGRPFSSPVRSGPRRRRHVERKALLSEGGGLAHKRYGPVCGCCSFWVLPPRAAPPLTVPTGRHASGPKVPRHHGPSCRPAGVGLAACLPYATAASACETGLPDHCLDERMLVPTLLLIRNDACDGRVNGDASIYAL